MFVRASFPDPLPAQQTRTRQQFTVSIHERYVRTRECLTLMPSQPADAVCIGHRHAILDSRMSSPACLSLPRACVGRLQVFECHSRIPTVKCWRMVLGAGSGMKTVKRMSATLDKTRKLAPAAPGDCFEETFQFQLSEFSPWLHRADTCTRAKYRHGSARAR